MRVLVTECHAAVDQATDDGFNPLHIAAHQSHAMHQGHAAAATQMAALRADLAAGSRG